MTNFTINRTEYFLIDLHRHRKNHELVNQLEKKIKHLEENADNSGKELSGKLAGLKSLRIMKNFRLIFKVKLAEKQVFLMAIDHRSTVYQ